MFYFSKILFLLCTIPNLLTKNQSAYFDNTEIKENSEVEFAKSHVKQRNISGGSSGYWSHIKTIDINKNKRIKYYKKVYSYEYQYPRELYVKGDYFEYRNNKTNSSFEFKVSEVKVETSSVSINTAAEIGTDYAKAIVECGVKFETSEYVELSYYYEFCFDDPRYYYPDGYYSADLYLLYDMYKFEIENYVEKVREVTYLEKTTERVITGYNNKGNPIYGTVDKYVYRTKTERYKEWVSAGNPLEYYIPRVRNENVVTEWAKCYESNPSWLH